MVKPFDHFVSKPASIFTWLKMAAFETVAPGLFYPTAHFCQLLGLSWEVIIKCHELCKIKSQVETGIQKSKLEQQSSVNRAYFFTKKNKSKCRHTEYFVMDLKVQHSVRSVCLSFLYIFVLFNRTFYICIKHRKNGIWQKNFSLWACVPSSCRKHKKK